MRSFSPRSHAQVESTGAARRAGRSGVGRGGRRGRRRRVGASAGRAHLHVVRQARRIAAAEVDQAFVDAKSPSSASVVASSCSVASPLVTMRRSTRPSSWKRSAVSVSSARGAAPRLASPSSARLPLPALAVKCSMRALSPCSAIATLAVAARPRPAGSCARRWCCRRARPVYSGAPKRPPMRGAGVQLAGQAPARRHPRAPGAEVGDPQLEHALAAACRPAGQAACGVRARHHGAGGHAERLPGQAGAEAPDAVAARPGRGAGRSGRALRVPTRR